MARHPMAAKIVCPGNQKAHPESEDAIPPDDGRAQKRTVSEKVGDKHSHPKRARGDNGHHAAVPRPLEDAEERDIDG